jgi:hypothetical protein
LKEKTSPEALVIFLRGDGIGSGGGGGGKDNGGGGWGDADKLAYDHVIDISIYNVDFC